MEDLYEQGITFRTSFVQTQTSRCSLNEHTIQSLWKRSILSLPGLYTDSCSQAAGKLTLDKKWYLESQLHPVVSRICAVIEGTDSGRIAECLGLDATKFHKNESRSQSNFDSVFAQPAVEVQCCSSFVLSYLPLRWIDLQVLSALWAHAVTVSHGELYRPCRSLSQLVSREFKGPYVLQDGVAGANSLICGMRCADAAGASFNPRALRLQVDNLLRRCLSRF